MGKTWTCQIEGLPELATSHWDVESLCSLFDCGECVADPADLGCPVDAGSDEEDGARASDESWEIPF